jgi:hypothetical protein
MIIPYTFIACSYGLISGINHLYFKNNNLNYNDKIDCLFMKISMSPICFPLYIYNDINNNDNDKMIKYSNYIDYILGK